MSHKPHIRKGIDQLFEEHPEWRLSYLQYQSKTNGLGTRVAGEQNTKTFWTALQDQKNRRA